MKKDLLIAMVAAALLHVVVLFGFEHGKDSVTSSEEITLVGDEPPPPPPPPPPPVPEDEEEGEDSDDPVLPEELFDAGLTEPPSTDVAMSAIAQIVRPEPPRPPRPAGLDRNLIPSGRRTNKDGKAIVPEIVFDLSELDRIPRVRYEAAPQYPYQLQRLGISGQVTAMWTVNKEGRVVEAHVESSSNPEFEKPVIDAVYKYRFEPGTKNGRPVSFRMRRTFNFDPKNTR